MQSEQSPSTQCAAHWSASELCVLVPEHHKLSKLAVYDVEVDCRLPNRSLAKNLLILISQP